MEIYDFNDNRDIHKRNGKGKGKTSSWEFGYDYSVGCNNEKCGFCGEIFFEEFVYKKCPCCECTMENGVYD